MKCYMPELGYGTMLKPNPYNGRILPVPFGSYMTLSEWSSINTLYTYKAQKEIQKIYEESSEPQKVRILWETVQKELGHTLLNDVEISKIALSKQELISSRLEFLESKPSIAIKKQRFEESIKKDTQKIVDTMVECLKDAEISFTEIELVILTGGSTEIPYIKKELCRLFSNAEISESGKFSSVSLGLGYEAARVYG